ncbi:MAG: tyrosine-type recombinase/integrase [Bacteroidetes bacterium]|nr:tyrosine-type recombinase/integrase [Bacteroidota bacterium]
MAVKKIDDGRYLVDIRDVHGVRRQKIFDRQKDAKDFETAIKKERLDHKLIGVGARKVRYRLDDAVRDFMTRKKEDLRPNSIRRYEQVLIEFKHFCNAIGVTFVNEFTPDHAAELFAALVVEKKDPKGSTDRVLKPKAKTVNMYLQVIKAVFKQEVTKGHIASSPFLHIRQLRVEPKHPDFYSEEELQRFFEQDIARPYRLFFLGLLDTGMRYDEAASLRWVDVDFEQRILHVRERDGFKPKTKNAERAIPISDRLVKVLKELKEHPYSEKLVFATVTGKKIPERTALAKCKAAAAKAGIETAKLHKFRSSFASHLVIQGAMIQEVSKLLGHSSIRETEIYAHLAPDRMHSQVNLICHVEINITIK